MGTCDSPNNSNRYVEGRMGENQKEGKDYDSNLSRRFSIVECLRWRHENETMGHVGNLGSVRIHGKKFVSSKEIVSFEDMIESQ